MARPLTTCSDPMSGFFALKPEVIKGAPLNAAGFKILLEVLVKGNISKVVEVPIVFKDREKGESKLGRGVIISYILHLIRLYLFPGSAPLLKFLFVGGTGMIVDITVFTLLMSLAKPGTSTLIIQAGSFSIAVVWNFIWNKIWTFGRHEFLSYCYSLFPQSSEGRKHRIPVGKVCLSRCYCVGSSFSIIPDWNTHFQHP